MLTYDDDVDIIDFVSQRDTEKLLKSSVRRNAEIAQLVEHHLAKVGVASSSLVFRSIKCGNSSVGRASPCQGGGREFESRFPLHIVCKFDVKLGPIAQLVRATGS